MFGATPNPNASKPATVAAIGNPFGGMNGVALAPKGVIGSTRIGNGTRAGSNVGVVGKVAAAGIPVAVIASTGSYGKVASAGIPSMAVAVASVPATQAPPKTTNLEVLSTARPSYERGPATSRPGRRSFTRHFYIDRPSSGTRRCTWTRTRTRRRSKARRGTDTIPSCNSRWASGRFNDQYCHHVSIGVI